MNFAAQIFATQDRLNALGHWRVNRDGLAGPQTWSSIVHEFGLGIDEVTQRNLPDVIAAAQRCLAKLGIYHGPANGIADAPTWAAVMNALDIPALPADAELPPHPPTEQPFEGQVDARSEAMIATLHPHARPKFLAALLAANKAVATQGLHWVITSGTRTYAQQHALWLQGRGLPGPVVTNADSGWSNHNFAIAADTTLFSGGEPVWDSPLYRRVWGPCVRAALLAWGGDWSGLVDEPHAEDRPEWAEGMSEGAMLARLRALTAQGKDIFSA